MPLVLVYPRDAAKAPLRLPEALTPGIVLDTLEKASALWREVTKQNGRPEGRPSQKLWLGFRR